MWVFFSSNPWRIQHGQEGGEEEIAMLEDLKPTKEQIEAADRFMRQISTGYQIADIERTAAFLAQRDARIIAEAKAEAYEEEGAMIGVNDSTEPLESHYCEGMSILRSSLLSAEKERDEYRNMISKLNVRLRMWEKDGPAAVKERDKLRARLEKLDE